jgi:hypothetical protein
LVTKVDGRNYECALATKASEAVKLVEMGFDYVCTIENLALFRRKIHHIGD